MAGRRQYIHELEDKLLYFVKRSDVGSWERLQERTGISGSTFDQVRDREHKAYRRLGIAHQLKLADEFDFSIDWPEWRDPLRKERDTRSLRDTADAFINRITTTASLGATLPSGLAENGMNAQRTRAESPAGKDLDLRIPLGVMAQVRLEFGQAAGPGCHQVLVELSCHAGAIAASNRRFSVRKPQLAIDCGEARGRLDALAGINGTPIIMTNSSGETSFSWIGTRRVPRWEVSASGSKIGYLWFDAGIVENLAYRDVLRVSMHAWFKHIDVTDGDAEAAFGIIDAKHGLLEQPAETVTIEQQRLIEHLAKLTLPADDNGCVEVAAHEIEVVRKQCDNA
jgi:hypothetical protein